MHELALCQAIADTVTSHADSRPVERVTARIGHLRQVVPDTLQFCWEMSVEGSALAGCALDVVYVPAEIRCKECGHTTVLADPIMLCDHCDGANVEVLTGEEFLIESIDVSNEPHEVS